MQTNHTRKSRLVLLALVLAAGLADGALGRLLLLLEGLDALGVGLDVLQHSEGHGVDEELVGADLRGLRDVVVSALALLLLNTQGRRE